MNTSLLCETVRERLRYIFRNMQLPSEWNGDRTAPTVFDSYLPPKRSVRKDVDTDFPYVTVRPSKGNVSLQGNMTTLRLILGVRSDDSGDGVMNLLLMKDTIIRELFRAPRHGVFTFEQEADWVMFDDQQDPTYELWIDTVWSGFLTPLEDEGDEW